jgi:hypothetical protein
MTSKEYPMPKLSVYVQDDLWREAVGAEPELNPSQLVQLALSEYVQRATARPSFARERPAESRERMERIREKLTEAARNRYGEGFAAGLDLAEQLPWSALDQLEDVKYKLGEWLEKHKPAQPTRYGFSGEDGQIYRTIKAARTGAYTAESIYRMGVQDALMDVWEEVRAGQPTSRVGG